MKELSIEDKANRYDKAIEIAKSKIKNNKDHVLYESDVIEIFPELKVSDDERIRKALIELFHDTVSNDEIFSDYGLDKTEVLAWLEKQGEQKSIDKVEPQFHEGDWVIGANNVFKIISLNDELNCYTVVTPNNEEVKIPYYFDNGQGHICSYHLWTIQDAKDGDVLAAHESLVLFKEIDGLNIRCYCSLYMGFNPSLSVDTLQNKDAFHPATKEQRDLLFQKMKEEGYEWNKDKKELKKL